MDPLVRSVLIIILEIPPPFIGCEPWNWTIKTICLYFHEIAFGIQSWNSALWSRKFLYFQSSSQDILDLCLYCMLLTSATSEASCWGLEMASVIGCLHLERRCVYWCCNVFYGPLLRPCLLRLLSSLLLFLNPLLSDLSTIMGYCSIFLQRNEGKTAADI